MSKYTKLEDLPVWQEAARLYNRVLAESCARQLTAWTASLEASPVQGKRHLTGPERERREASDKARGFRLSFLRNLKPGHPLYTSADARAARGEREEHPQEPMVNSQIANSQADISQTGNSQTGNSRIANSQASTPPLEPGLNQG
jgi:hypothetical protein